MAGSWFSDPIWRCIPNIIVVVALIIGSIVMADAVGTELGSGRRTVPLASLMEAMAASSCSSTGDGHGASMLEVVHRNSPCSKDPRPMDHGEMMIRDSLRVKWLGTTSGIRSQEGGDTRDSKLTKSAVSVPTKLGHGIGTGNYVVTVQLGTPGRKLQLDIDTGSGLTWIQCKGCTTCYNQTDPVFDPSKSTTYSAATCSSPACSRLVSGDCDFTDLNLNVHNCIDVTRYSIHLRAAQTNPSQPSSCSKSRPACGYSITYGDNSTSTGLISTDTLMLTSEDKITDFMFGCGLDNKGFEGSDGLFGLNNDKTSIISQTESMFGKYFSYCLPSSTKSTGFLTFGKGAYGRSKPSNSTTLGFTPLNATPHGGSSFYGIVITGINVGETTLSEGSSKILSHANSIIDSGTIITRLPPTVYAAVRSAYQKHMAKYPKAPAFELLDTCYDFSKFKTITYPKIEFTFDGGVKLDLHVSGTFFVNKMSQVCLAIAPNNADTDLVIFGNMQQRTFEVAYDVAGNKLGFSSNGCT